MSNKLSQIVASLDGSPSLSDRVVGVKSPVGTPSDVGVSYTTLLQLLIGGTTLSSQIQTQANAGSAGGTLYWVSLGGIKLLWATSASVTSGVAPTAVGFTFPSSFFSTIQSVTATAVNMATFGNQYGAVASYSASAMTIYPQSPSGAATTQLSAFVIGT